MEDFLHAIKEIPKSLSSRNPHTFKKKIEQAITHLRRLQRAEEESRRDGNILLKGELYLEPHPAIIEAGKKQALEKKDLFRRHIVPLNEAGGRDELLIHLGRASAYLETHTDAKQAEVQKLHDEVKRVLAFFQKR